jgi:hypothetical protein
LELAIEGVEELCAAMPVRGAVVARERSQQHGAHAEHAVVGPRLLGDPAEADERDLRRVDDADI